MKKGIKILIFAVGLILMGSLISFITQQEKVLLRFLFNSDILKK